MKKYLVGLVSILTIFGVSLYVTGCSSDDSGTSSSSYSGPGSQWNVTLNGDNTFVITRADTVGGAVVLTVNGTYTSLSAGYLKLTVSSATGTDAPAAGEIAYALNIPGFVFMLKPMSNDGEIIPMITSGTCPTSTMNLNWMVTSHEASGQGADLSTNKDLVGTASFNGSDTMTLPSKFDLQGNSLTAGDSMAGTCANGIISLPDDDANIWLSASGAALVQVMNGSRESAIVAMPQSTLTAASDLDGEYYGILFNEAVDENSESETAPIYMDVTNGVGTAGEFTDVDNATKDTVNTVSFNFASNVNSPANGFVSGTLTSGSDTTPMTCQTTTNVNGSGKNLMFCVGVDPDNYTNGSKDELYTVILLSK